MSRRTVRVDRRLTVYVAAAVGAELAALAFGLTANLTRHFNGRLTDLATLAGGIGLVLLGMAVERLKEINRG